MGNILTLTRIFVTLRTGPSYNLPTLLVNALLGKHQARKPMPMETARSYLTGFPVLETDRFILRDLRPSDTGNLMALRNDERVSSFVFREPFGSLEKASETIDRTHQAFREGSGYCWGGVLKEEEGDEVVGICWINRIDKANGRAEIGGELAVDHWGRDLPLHAIRRVIDYGFQELGLHSLEARIVPGNRGAIRVVEMLGFEKEGHLREAIKYNGRFYDQNIYSLRADA